MNLRNGLLPTQILYLNNCFEAHSEYIDSLKIINSAFFKKKSRVFAYSLLCITSSNQIEEKNF
jgi:hypothetical protein